MCLNARPKNLKANFIKKIVDALALKISSTAEMIDMFAIAANEE